VARLPYADANASPEVSRTLQSLPPLNLFRMLAHAETSFRPLLKFAGRLLVSTELDPKLRELAILRVSKLTPGAEYEWIQHYPIALGLGITQEQIDRVAGRDAPPFEDDDATLVLHFTDEVVRDASPSEETWNRISQRLSPREIIELLLVIGNYMMLGRVMATVRLDPDPPQGDAVIDNAVRRSGTPK
jgi:4-carboxymuconolactone decarboxylase